MIAVGDIAKVEVCKATLVKFETTITKCGPQPRFNNFTIDINGYELTKFLPCYWRNNLVNFNGRGYSFQQGNWMKVRPNINIETGNLLEELELENDNSIEILSEETSGVDMVMNQMSVLAEITATISEHAPINNLSKPHASSALPSGTR